MNDYKLSNFRKISKFGYERIKILGFLAFSANAKQLRVLWDAKHSIPSPRASLFALYMSSFFSGFEVSMKVKKFPLTKMIMSLPNMNVLTFLPGLTHLQEKKVRQNSPLEISFSSSSSSVVLITTVWECVSA